MAQPPLELQTSRLTLRSARPGDEHALHAAIAVSLPEFYPWLSFSASLSDLQTMAEVSELGAQHFEAGEAYIWRAWSPEGVMVGSVDLHRLNATVPSCEIGYWIRSDYAGNGYAREMVAAAIEVAQNSLSIVRIEARCDVRNARSCQLAQRLGFAFEGIARNSYRDAAGELGDLKVYALVSDE